MLTVTTTLLEIAGAVAVIAALAISASILVPAPWGLAAALGVVGLGFVSLSFLLTRGARR